MDDIQSLKPKTHVSISAVIAIVAIAGAGFLFFEWDNTKAALAELSAQYSDLQTKFAAKEEENRTLSEALYSEQQKTADLENELDDISDTVGKLQKLSKIDPELLQKYSKVFFLNEHYAPAAFKEVDSHYAYPESKVLNVHARVAPFLDRLLAAADDDNIDLRVQSAFRSFTEQSSLKSQYSVTYGAGSANQFSADQGYSEHQLGTTVDFTTKASAGALDGFNTTPAYDWLLKNAYDYGFVLSYPANNAYYVFEPWHWRFVGVSLAKYLHQKNMNFYDMDQRDIDKYLIKFFDR